MAATHVVRHLVGVEHVYLEKQNKRAEKKEEGGNMATVHVL